MKTSDEIYAELKADFESASGIKLFDGGDMSLRFAALAAQLESLYHEAEYVAAQSVPKTASGENLDGFVAIRGLSRLPAAAAIGTIRFTASGDESVSVEAGTRCRGKNGEEYVTTEDGVTDTESGFCDVAAKAASEGSSGNTPIGSITEMMLPPSGIVSCKNTVAFTGGRDRESDDELRLRLLDNCRAMINGGNAAYYKALALSDPNVGGAQVVPKARGIGTVDVYIADKKGLASSGLVSTVQAMMEENREICTDVLAKAAAAQPVRIELTVKAKSRYSPEYVALEVKETISAYFTGALLGKGVGIEELKRLAYAVDGVSGVTVAYPTADVAADKTKLPTVGTLTVTGEAE